MEQRLKLKDWIYHAEWGVFMAIVVGCFLFVHGEAVKVNNRLDLHMQQINARVDDLHTRVDDLHKEYYQLLKEMRDDRKSNQT